MAPDGPRGSPCPTAALDGSRDQVRTRGRGCLFDCVLGPAGQRSVSAYATAPTLVAKGVGQPEAWPQRLSAFLVCYYTSSSRAETQDVIFRGKGDLHELESGPEERALGARKAGCRLAQDGLEHGEAGARVDERQEEQGDEEESGERATEHFEESRPLVVERVHRRDRFELPQIVP